MKNITPMMQQYLRIKESHNDCILFFRLGDFYEMFFEDAILASKELEIALTARSIGNNEKADMCGVPYHVSDIYISKLVQKGYKVAICEQVEDPKEAKGIVDRQVVRIVTPGTILDTNVLDEKYNNYIASIYKEENNIGLAFIDLSTGDAFTTEFASNEKHIDNLLFDEFAKFRPKEVILSKRFNNNRFLKFLEYKLNAFINYSEMELFSDIYQKVSLYFNKEDLFIKDKVFSLKAVYILLNYLDETQHKNIEHITDIKFYNIDEYMSLDINTIDNLELKETIMTKEVKGSLLWTLDKTHTAMGARLLKRWLEQPLLNIEHIKRRQDIIEYFFNNIIVSGEIKSILKKIYDLERLIGKISYGNCNARDLLSLKYSIEDIPKLKEVLMNTRDKNILSIANKLDDLKDIYKVIDDSIYEDAPISLREGNLIKVGFDKNLDDLREGSFIGKELLAKIEIKERDKTGIKNLKIGFNKKSGYFIEVTKSNLKLVPEEYIRLQTLKNAERYYTEELKAIEYKILGSKDKSIDEEYYIFQKIRKYIKNQIIRVQSTSKAISELDCYISLAKVAYENNYIKPSINLDGNIDIKNGRHPVIEKSLDNNFVGNDTYLDNKKDLIKIITGPNMSGKSTYMRQVAILVLMSQIGSFIPADRADISIVDKIFTRIGASDNLSQGESTFMVEMNEVANIISNATSHSLIILDEVGRGTSTYDGLSIAWAIIEYIHDTIKSKTLFATHYHELTKLSDKYDDIKNLTILVEEKNNEVRFLRKIIDGSTDRSYGIEVAKIAGLNKSIIQRSKEILYSIENNNTNIEVDLFKDNKPIINYKDNDYLIDLIKRIEDINLNELTPIESINKLHQLQMYIKDLEVDLNE